MHSYTNRRMQNRELAHFILEREVSLSNERIQFWLRRIIAWRQTCLFGSHWKKWKLKLVLSVLYHYGWYCWNCLHLLTALVSLNFGPLLSLPVAPTSAFFLMLLQWTSRPNTSFISFSLNICFVIYVLTTESVWGLCLARIGYELLLWSQVIGVFVGWWHFNKMRIKSWERTYYCSFLLADKILQKFLFV